MLSDALTGDGGNPRPGASPFIDEIADLPANCLDIDPPPANRSSLQAFRRKQSQLTTV
ncbi:hypothetical protein [Jiella avicenniae]|uniref:Uncharacterized protein n=1 Tax=Jiella avicenniae TaxID=2907202 RepID=A0A9X1TCS3_9HYPH|nr:hypothetical protein [Jiella avicenniae]MCE7029323.1 hypothetical protein [Jiella avicenniae]